MSNQYFDWPAKPVAQRFVRYDTVRSRDANDAFDLVSAGFEKMPSPYALNAGSGNYAADTGAANAYAVALSSQITSYQPGLTIKFKAANSNTGASTLNVNGLGAKAIVQPDGGTPLAAGHILAGQMVEVQYDGLSFQLKASSIAFTNDPTAIQKQTYLVAQSSGFGSEYFAAPTPQWTSYQEGRTLYVIFNSTSGNNSTLAVNALAPVNLQRRLPNGAYGNIMAGDIPAGHRSRVTIMGTAWALVEDMPPIVLTRTIGASGSVTAADNERMLDVTASGVTLALASAATLGSGFMCSFLHSAYDVTLTGTFHDGATSKVIPAGASAILTSNGTSHRLTLFGRPVLRINETALSGSGNIDMTNVPSWVSEIKIKLRQASSNGTAVYTVHIGTGGVADTSATYTGGITQLANAAAINSVANSTQFQILAAVSAANVMDATVILTRNSDDGTSWNCMVSGQSISGTTTTGGGAKTLSGRLDMVRLGLNGSVNLWDAGFYSAEFSG